jgi:PLP dependent protein
VLEAIHLGLVTFGENRVQEAEIKIGDVSRVVAFEGLPTPAWHLVGHLQSNKARLAVELFSTVESVDSQRLAALLSRHAATMGRSIDVLLEVNVGGEASKFGFHPRSVDVVYGEIRQLPMVNVVGLMTVAPLASVGEASRPIFRELRALRDRLVAEFPGAELPQLSMGMTGDYPVAVEEGSTIVRIGRAIFGERTH